MLFSKISIKAICVGLSISVLSLSLPVVAQKPVSRLPKNCQWLKEVSTQQIRIRKQIQTSIINDANWNTDFAVPTGKTFQYYVGEMVPENDAAYEVTINLKYNNGTHSTPFTRNVPMTRNKVQSLRFQSGTNRQPFQINFRIGGARNNAYSIAVMACR